MAPNSTRTHFCNIWGCEQCDAVFFPEQVSLLHPKEKDWRIKNWHFYAKAYPNTYTLSQYKQAKERQLTGKMTDEDIRFTWPHIGNEVYVPTHNDLILGGLAIVENTRYLTRGNRAKEGYQLYIEECPSHVYYWEDIANIQEDLKKEFLDQRAHIILPEENIPKVGDHIYLETLYLRTKEYGNLNSEGDRAFDNLPDHANIPHIEFLIGGLAEVLRITPRVNEDGKVSYWIHLKERCGWSEWGKLAPKQTELKLKFGENRAYPYETSLRIHKADWEKECLKLFGYIPKHR